MFNVYILLLVCLSALKFCSCKTLVNTFDYTPLLVDKKSHEIGPEYVAINKNSDPDIVTLDAMDVTGNKNIEGIEYIFIYLF